MLACPECRKLYPSDASECPDDGHLLVAPELLLVDGERDEEPQLAPGTMVGEYRIERRLGVGSFGAVYAGKQPLIGKAVAIKVLHRRFTADTGVVQRFVSEARLVNRIRHRNIVDIFSFGVLPDKQPYFVMDLLEGMTLGELIQREGRLSVGETLEILRGIVAGLDAAHAAGVAHRDLKPDNVFLAVEAGGNEGAYFPKLLDFGVAKLVDDDRLHKTATGAAIGTPAYMAPEQCRGKRVDHRADVYALGVVIHEMLTGRRPFLGESAMDVLLMHVSDPPPSMSSMRPDLPPELDAPVLAMLAKDPEQRPSSAGTALAALVARARAAEGDRPAEMVEPAPSSFERALARREAATGREVGAGAGGTVASAQTPSKETPALQGATDALRIEHALGPAAPARGVSEAAAGADGDGAPAPEGPVAAPVRMAPAMTADGRFVLSAKGNAIKVWDIRTGQAIHTFQGPAAELPAAAPAPPVPSSKAPASRAARPAPAEGKRGGRSRSWVLIAAVAVILAAVVSLQKGRAQAPPVTAETAPPPPVSPPSGKVTLRLAVTPPDADVIVDGLHAGKAAEPLVLARSDQRRALRLERSGFESETLWVVPDRDSDLPPITLRAAPAGALAPGPTADPARPR